MEVYDNTQIISVVSLYKRKTITNIKQIWKN